MKHFRILVILLFLWNLPIFAEIPTFSLYQENCIPPQEFPQFVMSEKFDGVRGIWNGKILQTRKGNKIQAPNFWLTNFPPFVLDGELWLTHHSFEKTSSIVRDSIPNEEEWENLTYQVFDVRGVCDSCTLTERLKYLEEYLKDFPNAHIKIIPQIPIQSHEHLESYYQEVLKKGGEGIILRKNSNLQIGYKLKPFTDAECVVRDYTQGKGKHSDKIGAIWCEGEVLGENKQFKIGSGFNDKERANPPKIGTIITYKYQGYTKNKLPRFPVFLRIREGGI
ncbi:DNA ligase [Helicobacter sp. MIT 05-5294]|uniref:DNA ligase n=1 Tax=Helicobacter sp. MIT 05-5294 TaxID=1548150 RepID=UPI000A6C9FA8|nr:DNA ligase [Helicobacter sp. MIT 05-5294]